MATDKEVILSALQRERDELHDKIMQVDRIIKKVKNVDYSNDAEQLNEIGNYNKPRTKFFWELSKNVIGFPWHDETEQEERMCGKH
jgi:hypothetical protein